METKLETGYYWVNYEPKTLDQAGGEIILYYDQISGWWHGRCYLDNQQPTIISGPIPPPSRMFINREPGWYMCRVTYTEPAPYYFNGITFLGYDGRPISFQSSCFISDKPLIEKE